MSVEYAHLSSHEGVDARLARHAARRHGVFSYPEAAAFGATKEIVRRRVAAQRWQRMYQGVYRLAGVPETWRQRQLAACLALGASAAASHRSAGSLWRLAGLDAGLIEATVPRGGRSHLRGIIVHQLPLSQVDVTVVDAIPVTTPARTLLDLAAVASAHVVEEALDDALRRGLVSVSRLRWRLESLGRRRGSRMVRELLDARRGTTAWSQSVLETRFLRLLRGKGLAEPVQQFAIRDRGLVVATVDFAYPDRSLAIEVDGYRWHSGRADWQHDLSRRSELARLGWRVIHVTADDLHRRPDHVSRTVADALSRNA